MAGANLAAAPATPECADSCFSTILNDYGRSLIKEAQKASSSIAQPKALSTALQYTGRSIEFPLTQKEIYALASEKVLPKLSQQNGDWAIVLDVDDTVLSNYEYGRRTALSGKGYEPSTWDAWTKEKAASAIPGAKEFLDKVRAFAKNHPEHKGRIVFITDRTSSQEKDTMDNMVAKGLFVIGTDILLAKKDKDKTDTKNVRRACVEKGNTGTDPRCKAFAPMTIVALVGDSFRDFFEFYGADVYEKGRRELERGVDEGRCFVIPNPVYGQWQNLGAAEPYEKFKPFPTAAPTAPRN